MKFNALPVTRLFMELTSTPAAPKSVKEYLLKVDAGSSLSEVFVIDGSFNLVARGQGKLETRLPAGEYLVKYRAGDRYAEKWIALDKDLECAGYEAPIASSVAPIAESVGWSDPESRFAEELRQGQNLSIVIRDKDDTPPSDDVRICQTDCTTIAKLTAPAATGWVRGLESKVLGMGGNVPTGGYLLVVKTPGLRPYAMPLWVAPGCSTQVFMERHTLGMRGKQRRGPHLASASILIAGSQVPWWNVKRLLGLAETAKSVLSYNRPIVPETQEILESLDEKFACPILGLLAAHLLRIKFEYLNAKEDSAAPELKNLLETVVRNLAKIMPGSPDVGALELAIGLPNNADFSVPPMLAHSWAILVDSAASSIPTGSYADRIRPAVCATLPWLIWNKSRMAQAPKTPARKGRRTAAAAVPPELQEAASQLGKHLKLNVDADGRVTLTRKLATLEALGGGASKLKSAPKAAQVKAKPTPEKQVISTAARKRMFEAAKERWTAKKKPAKAAASATKVFPKKAATKIAKKRVLSPESRKMMAAAQQKRSAAKKKAEKSS